MGFELAGSSCGRRGGRSSSSVCSPLLGCGLVALAAGASLVASPAVARGAVGLAFAAPTLQAAQGSSGSFDLLIENTSPSSSFHLAGESVQLGITGGAGVHFTDTAATTAAPYVFPSSFDLNNGFTLDATGVAYPKDDFITSDVSDIPASFVVMAPGESLGVVHVSYTIDPGAVLGDRTLTFESLGAGTSTSDEVGQAVPFATINGTLTVTAAVPEPTSLGLLALPATAMLARRRRDAHY